MDTPAPDTSETIIPSLLDYVFQKVRESSDRHEMASVAKEADVDYSWLCKFATGKIPGASYTKIHHLAEFYFQRDCKAELDAGRPAPVSPWLEPAPSSASIPSPAP